MLTTSCEQTLTPVGINGEALPCIRLACATSGDRMTKYDKGTALISSALRAECKTAPAELDKSKG